MPQTQGGKLSICSSPTFAPPPPLSVTHLGVDMSMLLQAHSVAKGFATDITGKGPGSAVRAADVHF